MQVVIYCAKKKILQGKIWNAARGQYTRKIRLTAISLVLKITIVEPLLLDFLVLITMSLTLPNFWKSPPSFGAT
jgi:hypothetical protein